MVVVIKSAVVRLISDNHATKIVLVTRKVVKSASKDMRVKIDRKDLSVLLAQPMADDQKVCRTRLEQRTENLVHKDLGKKMRIRRVGIVLRSVRGSAMIANVMRVEESDPSVEIALKDHPVTAGALQGRITLATFLEMSHRLVGEARFSSSQNL